MLYRKTKSGTVSHGDKRRVACPAVRLRSCRASPASQAAAGLFAGTWINWQFAAITLPEFFSKRFRDEKNVLKTVAAVIILAFFSIYTALYASSPRLDYFFSFLYASYNI
ncbi:MAG: hypothetical protein LBG43_07725 [Treponema sp.]|jgi:hypothetical protein|nr:hypothetical protein [Treponema sp.]